MTVYIDDYNAPYRGMIMCHMLADTTDELLEMVDAIGIQRKWIQYEGVPHREHFDISKAKKVLAIRKGAIAITCRQMALITLNFQDRLNDEQKIELVELRKEWVKEAEYIRKVRTGKYHWIIQYECGCSTSVNRLREQTGYCATHGDSIQSKNRMFGEMLDD
jgi:hypothetical protein